MDKKNTPEITGQAADAVEPEKHEAEAAETTEAPQAPETSEAPAAPEKADALTYEIRRVDPNLRSTADGRLVTSVDGEEVDAEV